MPDYYPSDMVLAVAEAMHAADNYFVSYDQARAAMNLALEEAAQVADRMSNEWVAEWRRTLKIDQHMEGMSDGADDVAAAIRALKE